MKLFFVGVNVCRVGKSYWMCCDDYEFYYNKCQKYARECTDINHVQSRTLLFCHIHDQVGVVEDIQHQASDQVENNIVHDEDDPDGQMDFATEIRIKILTNLCVRKSDVEDYEAERRRLSQEYMDKLYRELEARVKMKNEIKEKICNAVEENWDDCDSNKMSKLEELEVPFFSPYN